MLPKVAQKVNKETERYLLTQLLGEQRSRKLSLKFLLGTSNSWKRFQRFPFLVSQTLQIQTDIQ